MLTGTPGPSPTWQMPFSARRCSTVPSELETIANFTPVACSAPQRLGRPGQHPAPDLRVGGEHGVQGDNGGGQLLRCGPGGDRVRLLVRGPHSLQLGGPAVEGGGAAEVGQVEPGPVDGHAGVLEDAGDHVVVGDVEDAADVEEDRFDACHVSQMLGGYTGPAGTLD